MNRHPHPLLIFIEEARLGVVKPLLAPSGLPIGAVGSSVACPVPDFSESEPAEYLSWMDLQ